VLVLLVILVTAVGSCVAMDDERNFNEERPPLNLQHDVLQDGTYNEFNSTKITPETFLQLAPPMPPELQKEADDWFAVEKNAKLIAHLAHTPEPFDAGTFRAKREGDKVLLAQCEDRIESLSRYNYVLRPLYQEEGSKKKHKFIIKLCGLSMKMQSLISAAGVDLDEEEKKFPDNKIKLSEWDFDYSRLDPERKTFMTLSRVVHNMRTKQVMKEEELQHVRLRNAYPYHIPGMPEELHDMNYAVIEEVVEGVEPFMVDGQDEYSQTQKARIDALPYATIREKYILARNAGDWDILPKNFYIDENGRIVLFDEEGYWKCMLTSQFFYQDINASSKKEVHDGQMAHKLYIETAVHGIEQLHNKIFEKKEQRDYVQQLFKSDQVLLQACKEYNIWPEFKEELDMKQ